MADGETSEADRELALVVAHVEKCANAMATAPFPHAPATARSLHMLAIALGEHKVHRRAGDRGDVVGDVVDVLRKVGAGAHEA